MRLLIFNDSQSMEVQSVVQKGDALYIRVIHVTPDELKSLFKDNFLTKKMILKEDNIEKTVYENYMVFSYIKEDAGGIYEIEMIQEGKDIETRLSETETVAQDAKETAEKSISALQEAVAELTILISTLGGGEKNV